MNNRQSPETEKKRVRKPDWLRVSLGNNLHFSTTGNIIQNHGLHTICQSGRCPNMGECWNRRTATFLIAGDICTRSCKFCNTRTGKPLPLDAGEPYKVACSIQQLGLKHAVITSVDRDDLPDYGASHWAETIRQIKKLNPQTTIEALIPDFRGGRACLQQVIDARPDLLSHNLETVRRLTPAVRSVARYDTSLAVLKQVAEAGIPAKSGLMLGLGETEDEVIETMNSLLDAGCRLLSIGQYLQPSSRNIPVSEYLSPEQFERYKHTGLSLGFKYIESAPLVRSSYHSIDFIKNQTKCY
ncbi:MAG: lipoyl synthase [Candidatus Symbiothrix sp.]|jgi:lipoic acid synthetase|nr:lipoyl synthase [Candidatus Symbiothrix sp.]